MLACLSVAQAAPQVKAYHGRTVVPEGTEVIIFFEASNTVSGDSMVIGVGKGGDGHSQAKLSHNQITLSDDQPTAQVTVSVDNQSGAQTGNLSFNITLTLDSYTGNPPNSLPSVELIIPPNDLEVILTGASTFEQQGTGPGVALNLEIENLESEKSFIVSSPGSPVVDVPLQSIVTIDGQEPFMFTAALKNGVLINDDLKP